MSAAFAIVGPIGPLELGIILLIVIVIFGPRRLPGIGRSLGEGMREFKDSVTGGKSDDERQKLAPGADAPSKPEEPEPVAASVESAGDAREKDAFGRSA
jgi:sec-independent protein translocase protein TatA